MSLKTIFPLHTTLTSINYYSMQAKYGKNNLIDHYSEVKYGEWKEKDKMENKHSWFYDTRSKIRRDGPSQKVHRDLTWKKKKM